jgi:hypothetical protein
VNGDGLDDVIVGVIGNSANGTRAGASFVVFGKEDGTDVELSEVEAGIGGFAIYGVSAGDRYGWAVSSAGDVNGDGFDDLAIAGNQLGAPYHDNYVVFGKSNTAAVNLQDVGEGSGGGFSVQYGYVKLSSISSAGDVNGDGFDDLIIGASAYDNLTGASFVVFGKADDEVVQLSEVIKSSNDQGFVINGASGGDRLGWSASSAGDINGDGLDDLIVGARDDDPNGVDSGASFVVFGKTDGVAIDLAEVEDPTNSKGFVINGVSAGDRSGNSVSSAGDVNGDGFDDLIIGADWDDPNGASSGSSFVVFGGNFTGAATQVGTLGADDLVGTAAIDVLIGGTGDDQLTGNGGADVLRGGAGDDVIAISDLDFAKIDGGNGTDTLRLDGSNLSLDLLQFKRTALQEVERIDLNGGGNALRLDKLSVLGLSGESNTLRVLGSGSDKVTLVGMGWAAGAQVTDAEGTFNVFTDGTAKIEIEADVD